MTPSIMQGTMRLAKRDGKKENQSTDLQRGRRIAVKGAGTSTQTMCDKVFGLETAGWGNERVR